MHGSMKENDEFLGLRKESESVMLAQAVGPVFDVIYPSVPSLPYSMGLS